MNSELLRITLQAAVPLWAWKLRSRPLDQLVSLAHNQLADIVASKGDILQFKSKKKGETADAFNALAEGLAILSFAPGGVTFSGDHYENVHPDSLSKEGQYAPAGSQPKPLVKTQPIPDLDMSDEAIAASEAEMKAIIEHAKKELVP